MTPSIIDALRRLVDAIVDLFRNDDLRMLHLRARSWRRHFRRLLPECRHEKAGAGPAFSYDLEILGRGDRI